MTDFVSEASRTDRAEVGGFMNPERIADALELRPGMIAADFGSGSGHFTLAMARRVGAGGRVWAVDIQKSSLNLIKSRAALEHLLQIETVWADLELPRGSRLLDQSVDLVLVSNILFQTGEQRSLMTEASRILKPGGRLAIIEWNEESFPAGPPAPRRIGRVQTRRLAEAAGFRFAREFDAGNRHYGLLFERPGTSRP